MQTESSEVVKSKYRTEIDGGNKKTGLPAHQSILLLFLWMEEKMGDYLTCTLPKHPRQSEG